jgi:tetratricopeptide (TPR) repeat protein
MSSRNGTIGIAGVLLAAGACHWGHDEKAAVMSFDIAEHYYQHGKFDQAKQMYGRTLENCGDHDQAKIGFAHACREVGTLLYRQSWSLAEQGRPDEAKKVFNEATENHATSFRMLKALLAEGTEENQARYGLGLLHYHRATSLIPYPFALEDRIARQQERDYAIEQFKKVVEKVPNSFLSHRYLGLAYFSAGRYQEGRDHLKIFHDVRQRDFETVVQWPADTDEQKKRKDEGLRQVEKDIHDVREVLGEYFIALSREREKLDLRKDRTPEEQQRLATLAREALEMEGYLKSFRLVAMGDAELQLRQRCQNFLDVINRSNVVEVLSFLAFAPSEEAQFRRKVEERLATGVKFRKVRYRSVVIEGMNATVSILFDEVADKGTRPDLERSIRWRQIGGAWRAAELP